MTRGLPNPYLTTPGDPPTRPWLAPDRDATRWWVMWGTRKIAFLRIATLEQLRAVEDFGPRELMPVDLPPEDP